MGFQGLAIIQLYVSCESSVLPSGSGSCSFRWFFPPERLEHKLFLHNKQTVLFLELLCISLCFTAEFLPRALCGFSFFMVHAWCPSWVSSACLIHVLFTPSLRSLIKLLNKPRLNNPPCHTPLDISSQLCAYHQPLFGSFCLIVLLSKLV